MALADQAGVLAVQKLNDETLPQLKKDMAELLDSALIRVEAIVARTEALVARVDGAMVMFKLGPEPK
jgi:ribosomal protein L14